MNSLDSLSEQQWELLETAVTEAVEAMLSQMTPEQLYELCRWNH